MDFKITTHAGSSSFVRSSPAYLTSDPVAWPSASLISALSMPPVQPELLLGASTGTVGSGFPPHLLGAGLPALEDLDKPISGDRVISE
jgi:hypothetical protein